MLVVFAFSCSSPSVKSPHNAEQEPLRTSLSENSSYPIESQLTEILDHVQPWLDHILPWPDYSTNFLNASWDGLVLAVT